MKFRLFAALIGASLVLGAAAVAQEYEEPLESVFTRNPIRAVWESVRWYGDATLVTLGAVQTDVQDVAIAVDGIGGTIAVVSDAVAAVGEGMPSMSTSCSAAVATVTVCQGLDCSTKLRYPCAPFGCDAQGKTCGTSCSISKDCAPGHECDYVTQQCVPVSYRCGYGKVIASWGAEYSCDGHACQAGACVAHCGSNLNCVDGYSCVNNRCVK